MLLQLSLSRNYLTGDVKHVPPSLRAVIVSANYLTCNMADMSACVNLSVGTLQGLQQALVECELKLHFLSEPVTEAIKNVGKAIEAETFSNPYAIYKHVEPVEYNNIALMWSGNVSRSFAKV